MGEMSSGEEAAGSDELSGTDSGTRSEEWPEVKLPRQKGNRFTCDRRDNGSDDQADQSAGERDGDVLVGTEGYGGDSTGAGRFAL